jgi:hypothetical protein
VGIELHHQKIKDGIVYLACGREESLVHHFWSCPHSVAAWNALTEHVNVSLGQPPKVLWCHSELKGWILDWIGKSNDDKRAWFITMLYNLWIARNDARETKKLAYLKSVAMKTIAGVEEWHNLHAPSTTMSAKQKERWLVPDYGWCKVNADGAFHSATGLGGGGVVLRDHHGSFIAGATHFFPHTFDAEDAELMACKRALLLSQRTCRFKGSPWKRTVSGLR